MGGRNLGIFSNTCAGTRIMFIFLWWDEAVRARSGSDQTDASGGAEGGMG